MNTQKYKAFVEAVRHHNLTSAAKALHYTQPGLSRMISSLEDELGFPLLFRAKNGVSPTEAGKQIYDYAVRIIELESELDQIVAQINGAITGKLRVTSYLIELVQWLPPVIKYFSEHYPDVEFFLFEGECDEQISMLKNNLSDVAVFCGPVPDGFFLFRCTGIRQWFSFQKTMNWCKRKPSIRRICSSIQLLCSTKALPKKPTMCFTLYRNPFMGNTP